jgi:hypothetical protein
MLALAVRGEHSSRTLAGKDKGALLTGPLVTSAGLRTHPSFGI